MPISPTYAQWNVKEAQHVACWTCEHFQRYDDNPAPVECFGECRKDPPREWRDIHDVNTGINTNAWGYCTYIFFGNVAWCNGYQRSLEENIPPSPGDSATHCNTTTYPSAVWPIDYNGGAVPPFSKKPVSESCWYCNHFQRDIEDPDPGAGACLGYCQIAPPQRQYSDQPSGGPPPPRFENVFVFPRILYGPFFWCSRWERVTNPSDIPDPPDSGNGPCVP